MLLQTGYYRVHHSKMITTSHTLNQAPSGAEEMLTGVSGKGMSMFSPGDTESPSLMGEAVVDSSEET